MTEDNKNNNENVQGREENVSSFDNSSTQNQIQPDYENNGYDYTRQKNNGVDDDLNNLGTEALHSVGVPKPIAKAAVKTNGGPLSPGNLLGNKSISSNARSALGNAKGKLLGDNQENNNNGRSGILKTGANMISGKLLGGPKGKFAKPNSGSADPTERQKHNEMANKVNRESDSSIPDSKPLEKKTDLPEKEGLEKKDESNEKNNGPLGKLGGLSSLKNGLGGGLSGAKDKGKAAVKTAVKNKIKHLFIAGLPWTVIIPLVLFVVLFLILIFAALFGDSDNSSSDSSSSSTNCGGISLVSTSLSRDEFIKKLEEYGSTYANAKNFADHAGTIYDIAKKNNFNPELIPIRAEIEGYSPGGSTYNYYGIGCTNTGGGSDCTNYASFDAGVLGYIKLIQSYGVDDFIKIYSEKHYAFIGNYWYNPGGSGTGGCYYFPYIKKYMSSSRASQVATYCDSNHTCSGSSCTKTNDEDQLAYSKFQLEKTVEYKKSIFGIETNYSCDDNGKDSGIKSPKNSDGISGLDVAEYAVKKFDSFGYDQGRRMSDSFVDCSSMVWRAYRDKANIMMGGSEKYASDVKGIYNWCKKNNKLVNGNDMQPGDLAIYSSLGHIEIYYKNNQIFGAHGNTGNYAAHDKQVSLESFNKGSFGYFCRPFK